MRKMSFKYLVSSAFVVFFAINAAAQQDYILDTSNSELVISGTSSIHDWEMEVETFNGDITLMPGEKESIVEIRAINFTCQVLDINSGKRIMDNKAHDALKEERYPRINFQLDTGNLIKHSGGKGSLPGILNVAGKAREVQLHFSWYFEEEDGFLVKGQAPLKMSDFGITPPKAMLGALKTGDEVLVRFIFEFTKSRQELSGVSEVDDTDKRVNTNN
jgi:polyisoprenoid-binding protein YceI